MVAIIAPCCQDHSRRPCCSTLTNACGMKMLLKIMLAQLARTLTEWHCISFTDLIDKMELLDWNVANKDFWSRLAKSLHCQKASVTWAGKVDQKLASVLVSEKMSWATVTWSIWKCKS